MHRRRSGAAGFASSKREHLRDARRDRVTRVEPSSLSRVRYESPAHVEPQYGRGLALIVLATIAALLAWAAFSPSLDLLQPEPAAHAEVSR